MDLSKHSPVSQCSACGKPLGNGYIVQTKTQGIMHKSCATPAELESAVQLNSFSSGSIEHDPVNHPKHYTEHPSGIECIQVTRHMTFNLGNAVKYLWRAGKKDPTIQDLEKARWYILDEIIRLKREKGLELTEEEQKRK